MVFIGGVSRSGTTLLSQLFDGHPRLMAFGDEVQFLKMAPKLRKWRDDPEQYLWHMLGVPFDYEKNQKLAPTVPINPDRNLKFFGTWKAIAKNSPDAEGDRLQLLKQIQNRATERELFLSFAELYAKRVSNCPPSVETILEKTPGNEFHFQRYQELFPSVKFIHLIRDPIDNLRSRVVRKGKIVPSKINWVGIVNMAYEWKRSLMVGLKNYQQSPENYRILRYEDLVSDPETTLRELAAFLRIDFHPTMLKQTSEGGKVLMKNVGHERVERKAGKIDTKALQTDSAQILGERLVRQIAATLGSSYSLIGYRKYDRYFDGNRLFNLIYRHRLESGKQWGLRLPFAALFGDWRIRQDWRTEAFLTSDSAAAA